MPTPIPKTLGQRIRYLRTKAGISRDSLSKQTGIANSNLSLYEQDKISNPNIIKIKKIAKVLKIKASGLLDIN